MANCNTKEKRVQFNLVNNSSSAIEFDVFKQSLNSVETEDSSQSVAPSGSPATTVSTAPYRDTLLNSNDESIYYELVSGFTPALRVRQNNSTITTVNIPLTNPASLTYASSEDKIYVGDLANNEVVVFDAVTNSIITTITGFANDVIQVVYVPLTNEVWVTTFDVSTNVQIIDVTTDTIVASPSFPSARLSDVVFNSVDSSLYFASETTDEIWVVNPTTRLLITNTSTPQTTPLCVGIVGDKVYVGYDNTKTSFDIYDIGGDSFTANISYGGGGAEIYKSNFVYVPIWDRVYAYLSDGRVIGVSAQTETIEDVFTGLDTGEYAYVFYYGGNQLYAYRSPNRYVWQGTFIQTPFYIGGSSDYNSFIQNLEYSPIIVKCLNVYTQNQDQLYNSISLKRKDANGHELSDPNFPIIRVDAYQKQDNRSSIDIEDVIFDGRTFFSKYKINPNETVVFELCYEQLNRFCMGEFPSMFPEKRRIDIPVKSSKGFVTKAESERFKVQKDCQKLQVSVTNSTGSDNVFDFFVADQTKLHVNTAQATFSDVDQYNQLMQQLRDSPLLIAGVDVIGANQDQLNEPINVSTEDANGDSLTYQHFPINFVDSSQKSSNRIFIKTNQLVIDGYTTIPSYNIKANSSITFILYYRQFKRSDFLNTHVFKRLKSPIVDNGTKLGYDIEYYNDVSQVSDNFTNFEGSYEKEKMENSVNNPKNFIFDVEQAYSRNLDNDSGADNPAQKFLKKQNLITDYSNKKQRTFKNS